MKKLCDEVFGNVPHARLRQSSIPYRSCTRTKRWGMTTPSPQFRESTLGEHCQWHSPEGTGGLQVELERGAAAAAAARATVRRAAPAAPKSRVSRPLMASASVRTFALLRLSPVCAPNHPSDAALALAQVFVFIARVIGPAQVCGFAELEADSSGSVARLAEHACAKFSHWKVDADEVELYLAAADGDEEPSAEAIAAALSGPRLQIGWKLYRAGIVAGSWLLARVPPPPVVAPGACRQRPSVSFRRPLSRAPHRPAPLVVAATGDSAAIVARLAQLAEGLVFLSKKVELVVDKLELVSYRSTHLLSKTSEAKLRNGALFFIQTSLCGSPVFCGFFVSERVALTINHDAMFSAGKTPSPIFGRSSETPHRELQFELFSTNSDLDFSVLKLKDGQRDASAYFLLPSFDSVEGGIDLGLVTMSIGSSAELASMPRISQHRVHVTSCDDKYICYDGTSTWKGDSGGALLFEEGCVVGLHLGVIDDKPEPALPISPHASSGTLKRGHGGGARAPDRSLAASSSAKICRALLLSHPAVREAVEAARHSVAAI